MAALPQDARHIRCALEQAAKGLVALVEHSRQPAHPVERRPELWGDAVDRVGQRVQRLIQLGGVGVGGVGGELAERIGQRIRGAGSGHRDHVGRLQCALAVGFQGQHPLTQQGSGADVRGGVGAQPHRAPDHEGHQRLATLQGHVGHGAHLDSGHLDIVTRHQATGLGEQGLVLDRRRPGQDPLGLQADGDDQNDQHHAEEARPDERGTTVFQHQGSAHLPVCWTIQGKYAVRPCRSVTRNDSPHRY